MKVLEEYGVHIINLAVVEHMFKEYDSDKI
jgi:hypothetical protein